MKIYLDNCALGRLTDQQDQPRLVAERQAVLSCLLLVQRGQVDWIASAALIEEIRRNREVPKRDQAIAVLATATVTLDYCKAVLVRADSLERLGFSRFDALHLAFAEAAGVHVLLTTDDRLVRTALRTRAHPDGVKVEVANPVDWLARRER